MKINKNDREFNRGVFMGLAGGLLVAWSQIASEEIIKLLNIPNNYLSKIFISLFIAIFLFVIFIITYPLFKKK